MAEKKFDRTRFNDSVNVEKLQASDAEMDAVTEKKRGDYAKFFSIENGKNKFRIYPAHSNEDNWIEAKQTWMLPFDVEERDEKGEVKLDKKQKPIIKRKTKPVFDARIHSNTKEDIVHIYIELLKQKFKEENDALPEKEKLTDDELNEKLIPVYGQYPKVYGIAGKPEWVVYVDKYVGATKQFGRVSFGKAVKQRINQLVAVDDSESPVNGKNPFTNLEDGRLIIITYNDKAQKAQDYYTTEIDSSTEPIEIPGRGKVLVQKTYPLTDEDLARFDKFPSLTKQYKNSYTKKDFDLAIKGLTIFDDENDFGLFQYDEFTDQINPLRDKFPDPEEVEEKGDAKEAAGDEEDEFAEMTREEMKTFARKNKTGIFATASMSDEELRANIRQWVKDNAEPEQESTEEEDDNVDEEEENTKPVAQKTSSLKSKAAGVKKTSKK